MPDTKICRACDVEKPVDQFYTKGVLVSGKKRYRADCITCTIAALDANPDERERVRAATAGWRAADPERGRQSSRNSWAAHKPERHAAQHEARFDPVRRPTILANARKSVAKHKDKRYAETKAHRAANAEHYRAYLKKYWRDNPEKAAAYQATRRARIAGADGHHNSTDILTIRARQNDTCNNPMCAVSLNGRGAVDHIVALVNGGSNWPVNLQLLCKPCNSKKRSRDNATFLRCYAIEKGLPQPIAQVPPELDDDTLEDAA